MTTQIKHPSLTGKERLVKQGIIDGERTFTGPFGLQVGVTDYCNFACEFCHTFSHRRPSDATVAPRNQIAPAVFFRLVDDAASLDVEQISLVGVGEPLLHDQIIDFVKRIGDAGIRSMLTTNGLALTDEKLDGLIEAGLDILNVSVNAATEETYAAVNGPSKGAFFATLVDRLKRLGRLSNRPRLSLRFVVSRRTAPELDAFARLVTDVGADEAVFQNYLPHRWATDIALDDAVKRNVTTRLIAVGQELDAAGIENNARFLAGLYRGEGDPEADPDYFRHHPCTVGWTYALIMEDGSVRPCCYCGGSLGNINERSFKEIWEGESYTSFRQAAMALPKTGVAADWCVCLTQCGSIRDNVRTRHRLHLREG